jgi:hypothetical protein
MGKKLTIVLVIMTILAVLVVAGDDETRASLKARLANR